MSRSVEPKHVAAVVIVSLLAAAGCSGTSGDEARIAGQVTYNGEPLPYGEMRLVQPQVSGGNSIGRAIVEQGAFDTADSDWAATPGVVAVSLEGYERDPQGAEDADLQAITLFTSYSTEVTVGAGHNDIDLEITDEETVSVGGR